MPSLQPERSTSDLSASEQEDPLPGLPPASSFPQAKAIWLSTLGAALIGGLLTWAVGEVLWTRIHSAQTPRIVAFPTGADRSRMIAEMARSNALSFVQQGAILGVFWGLAGGFGQRKPVAGLVAALVGGGLGALAAWGAARGLLPVYYKNVDPQLNDLTYPLLTHGGIWAAIGAAAGLAFGLGLGGQRRWLRCAVGGMLGGAFATVVYDLVGAIAFPLDKTSQPVSPTVVTRLFAQFAVAVFVAIGTAVCAVESTRRPPAPAP